MNSPHRLRTDGGVRPDRSSHRTVRPVMVAVGLALALAGCGSRDPGAHGGAPGSSDPATATSTAPRAVRGSEGSQVTPGARVLCAAFPLGVARRLLPHAATRTPYASARYGPGCGWSTDRYSPGTANANLRSLDRIAALNGKTPTAFAAEQARNPHAVRLPGLPHGSYTAAPGKIGTDVEVDWCQDRHCYGLLVLGTAARVPRPTPAVMGAEAEAIARRLSREALPGRGH